MHVNLSSHAHHMLAEREVLGWEHSHWLLNTVLMAADKTKKVSVPVKTFLVMYFKGFPYKL